MRALLLLAALAVAATYASADPLVVCYFSSWAVYRPGFGKFDVEDLDPHLCTHAVFGFAGLSNQTWSIEVLDPWNENCPDDEPEGNACAFDRFVALKEQNPSLKAILAVGGWNEGSEDYSTMVADPAKRTIFIESCIELVQKEGFDGLDIDWEYPTQRGGVPEDKDNFILLLDEFRVRFDELGLIMTAALASGKPTVDPSYDVAGLSRNLDVLSIMTYDYHGAWENFTHHNAPLCGHPDDYGNFTYFNAVFSINYWIELGAPKEKIVMGIPVYGRCFTLDDPEQHEIWAPANSAGKPGPYTRLPGTLGWNEICEMLNDPTKGCTSVRDPVMYEPYMYCTSNDIWCGYDDEESVSEKARFARRAGVAGIMVWTVDTDDFRPGCGDRKFGLINSMKDAFNEEPDLNYQECSRKVIPTTPPPTTTTTEPPTTTTTEPPTTTTTEPTTTTTEPTTTTTEPTTTTTEPTTTTTEPTTTTTEPPTTTTTSTTTEATTAAPTTTSNPLTTTPPNGYNPPDCDANPDVDFYPHADCNKYWWCLSTGPELWLCSPGTYFNPETLICEYPENVDTSNCNVWLCEADGDVFAGADCNEYYVCEHGQPVQQCCADGLYFNPAIGQCDTPAHVDDSTCNVTGQECVPK